MLVLCRKEGESLIIRVGNEKIKVKIIKRDKFNIRMGIEAPRHVSVDREEIYNSKVLAGEIIDNVDEDVPHGTNGNLKLRGEYEK